MINKIIETFNEFAPEKIFETTDSPQSASWITKKIKNAIVNKQIDSKTDSGAYHWKPN